jgi:hypothetical protein
MGDRIAGSSGQLHKAHLLGDGLVALLLIAVGALIGVAIALTRSRRNQ